MAASTYSCCLSIDYYSIYAVEFSTPIYPIRLVTDTDNSTHNSSLFYGRLEIRNGTDSDSPWGTICKNGWGIEDAEIACRQLG